jgi:Uma2 family endonuclease
MTAQQFLQLGEDPPGVRLELVEGEIAVSPSPTPAHSHAIVKLISLLDAYVEEHDIGRVFQDVDTILDRYNVRRPDILFFSKSRLHLVGKKALQGPPDLIVEVVSPTSGRIDREDKFAQYAAAGVRFYWIVDPEDRTFHAWRLEDGKYIPTGQGRADDTLRVEPFTDLPIALKRLWHP